MSEHPRGSPRTGLWYMTGICLTTTLGGFLFGFDTAVASGTIGFLKSQFQLSPGALHLVRHPGNQGQDARRDREILGGTEAEMIPIAASLLLAMSALPGQAGELLVRRDHLFAESSDWLEGYAETILGERIDYPRLREGCPTALLTRATDGTKAIEWWTEAVPERMPAERVVFFWLAGMQMQGPRHRFYLLVDDEPRFEFTSSDLDEWSVTSPDGGRLEFSAFSRDQHRDGFGYLRLFAPRAWLTEGVPLRLRVVGEAAGAETWFMTYECPDALAYFRRESEQRGWLELTLSEAGAGTRVEVRAPGRWAGRKLAIRFGESYTNSTKLVATERGAWAAWSVPAARASMAGQPLRVTIDELPLATDVTAFAAVDTASLLEERIVRVVAEEAEEGPWTLRVLMDYEPELTRDLITLSDSCPAGSEIHIVSSSHQDIAWMDSPQQCIEDRDRQIITPALEQLRTDPDYRFCMENVLCLREYLERHPERREEIAEFTRAGRITWGAAYNAPYEEMYSGEALVRQFYLGRRWLRDALPGCDALTYWNVDVPGRSLQMPQILARSGVEYAIISRHEEGFFRWLAPDGSGAWFWSPGHYGRSFPHLAKEFFGAAEHVAAVAAKWARLPREPGKPVVAPILSDWDMGAPKVYGKLVERWTGLDSLLLEDGSWRRLSLPTLKHASSTETMAAMAAAYPDAPVITGERPAVWLYIHGPSHQRALAAAREGSRLLTEAETFATLRSLVEGSFESYPQERLTEAWEAAIYPDHGWGGKKGEITDALFLEKLEHARDLGRELRDEAMTAIASRVRTDPSKGIPIVVFNSLSWPRSGHVSLEVDVDLDVIRFPGSTFLHNSRGEEVGVVSCRLEDEPKENRIRAQVDFHARNVPPVGYEIYYLSAREFLEEFDRKIDAIHTGREWETDHYRILLGKGGIKKLYDKELGCDLLDTHHFDGGEIFTLRSVGHGAGEFADVQQPTLEGFERLRAKPEESRVGPWELQYSARGFVLRRRARFEHAEVILDITFYFTIKRIDFDVQLLGFDGTAYREFRLAIPLAMKNASVAYEVPFGVVEVGKDEIPGAAGERYTTPCAEVHPRGIGNWISASNDTFGVTLSSSVAVADWIDLRDPDSTSPVLQPILLASRRSCHGEGPLYAQRGDHSFHFSLTSHEPGWRNGDRFGKEANAPLRAMRADPAESADLPERHSFLTLQPEGVFLSTLKKAEDGDGVIVRVYDGHGVDSAATIELFGGFEKAIRTNLIEDELGPLPLEDGAVKIELGHHSIETIRLE